jgi:protein ImuB
MPRLALDRLTRREDARLSGPFAIIAEIKSAWRLTHLNDDALRAGLRPGMTLADARSICPHVLSEPADPVREGALLRALWRWADMLSPYVAMDPPDGLVLDITGCAHLFGGEMGMSEEARTRLEEMQIESRIGLADTRRAGWALARYGTHSIEISPLGQTAAALTSLPLEALNLSPACVNDLRRVGLKTIGELYPIKSAELARRFGLELPQALSKALGHTPDPVTPKSADRVYAARMNLPEPIGLADDVLGVLRRLAEPVCAKLLTDQKGARRFEFTVRAVDKGDKQLAIGFAKPCAEPDAVVQQFTHDLGELTLDFGADGFRLVAHSIEPRREKQVSLAEGIAASDGVTQLISTLGNRLGFDRVRRWLPGDSHVPEHEFVTVEAVSSTPVEDWPVSARARPIRFYSPPEPVELIEPGRPPKQFSWRRQTYETASAEGPERLSDEWWRVGARPQRDYWRVQTQSGVRLWMLNYPGVKRALWYVAGQLP